MHVSTAGLYARLGAGLRDLQEQLAAAQQEIATGRRADLAAVLRQDTSRDIELHAGLTRAQAFQGTIDVVAPRLEAMQQLLAGIQGLGQQLRGQALAARDATSRRVLQSEAQSALAQLTSLLDTRSGGRALLAGVVLDAQPIRDPASVSPATGLSPSAAVAQVIAAHGPLTDAAAVAAAVSGPDGLDAAFADQSSDARVNFSATFYAGATTGTVTARIDQDETVDYGLRADAQPFRQLLEGLHMLAAVAPGSIPEAAYAAWQDAATARLQQGLDGVTGLAGQLGATQQALEDAKARHEATATQLTTLVATLEQADPAAAAVHVSQIQAQLEATYAITARLGRLSLANYL